MAKAGFTKTYGAPMMRELKTKANSLGIDIDWHINSDGKYAVVHRGVAHVAPTVAAACCFIMGMMSVVAEPLDENNSQGLVSIESMIDRINTDPVFVGQVIHGLYTRQRHLAVDESLFKQCVNWIGRGNVLNGRHLKQARARLLNHYVPNVIIA